MSQPQPDDWQHHADVLFPSAEAERAALLRHLQDQFPRESGVLRQAGAGVIVATLFPQTYAGLWGVVSINLPTGKSFPLLVYGDKLSLDREASVRIDDDGLSIAAVSFWQRFVGLLGKSLARSVGGAH